MLPNSSFSTLIFSSKSFADESMFVKKSSSTISIPVNSIAFSKSFSRFSINSFLAFCSFNWVFKRISSKLFFALNAISSIGFVSSSSSSSTFVNKFTMSTSASDKAFSTFLSALSTWNSIFLSLRSIFLSTFLSAIFALLSSTFLEILAFFL